MWKDAFKGHVVVDYKWYVTAKVLFWVLVTALLASMIYVGAETGVGTGEALSPQNASADERPAMETKKAVLGWMRRNSEMPQELLSNIYDTAAKNMNADLILAVCAVESNFNPNVRSRKGAVGLMGVIPEIWMAELKDANLVRDRRDLYLIARNIAAGAYVLKRYMEKTGDFDRALLEYSGGDPEYSSKVVRAMREIYLARGMHNSKNGV